MSVIIACHHQIGRQRIEAFERPLALRAMPGQLKIGDPEVTGRVAAADACMVHLTPGEGGEVHPVASQNAGADGPGGDRGPGRHHGLAIAAGITEQPVAPQKEHVQGFEKMCVHTTSLACGSSD